MKTALIAFLMSITLATAAQADIRQPKSFIGYGGDCYQQKDLQTINRCLIESTRGGRG